MPQQARNGSWMITYTGKMFYPYDLREEDFAIEDIAHALGMLCRYGGHCKRFYSVAEHSVHVSHLVPREHALAGLMHDATEAYLVDMPKPIKAGFPQYKEMEAKLWEIIARKWRLPVVLPSEVHQADMDMLFHEMDAILPPIPDDATWGMGAVRPAVLRPEIVRGWAPWEAEQQFLHRFRSLTT